MLTERFSILIYIYFFNNGELARLLFSCTDPNTIDNAFPELINIAFCFRSLPFDVTVDMMSSVNETFISIPGSLDAYRLSCLA